MEKKGAEGAESNAEPESLGRLGDFLRASFPADNHDSVSDDMTRSLLHLSREAKADPMRVKLPEPDKTAEE